MPTIEILDSRLFPSRVPTRAGRLDRLITYTVDGKRENTFIAVVPSDTPSDEEVKTAVRAAEQVRAGHVGKKLTI